MVTLFCALVGEAGSAFPVDIDEDKTVGHLKDEIWKKLPKNDTFVAYQLQLYLAKKGAAWLSSNDTDVKKLNNKWLDINGTNAVTLDKDKNPQVNDEDGNVLGFEKMVPSLSIGNASHFGKGFKPTEGDIHVLVVVPTDGVVVPQSIQVAVPIGPEVDLRSCDNLLAFLESEMINKDATVSKPHLLEADSLQFRLVGRKEAITTAASCFSNIIAVSGTKASDRTKNPIPVCSGISGLGKTRMLEEGKNILQYVMKLDRTRIASVIVPYFNGHNPQPVEESMSIEASFSWRLLYQFFLEKNCNLEFDEWFESHLPCNGGQLKLKRAIKVVERKLDKKKGPIYFFLGVDEYQKIEKIGTRRKDPNTSLLRELVETIGEFLCSKSSNMVLLPMFAGTDLSVIASGSIANSSYYVTRRLPMSLLTLDQVYTIVESNQNFAELLHYKRICVHLFFLGGVPRWVVDYLIELKKNIIPGECFDVNTINGCYDTILLSYVDAYMSSLEMSKFVRLAAFAISSLLVSPNDEFCEGKKWSRLRDSSLCVLVRYAVGQCRVEVPYTLLHCIGNKSLVDMKSDAELHFVNALKDLIKYVDNNLLVLQPWQLWEMFGACFYAMRINALLVLGQSSVTLEQLLPGALMTSATGSISVDLVPLKIFQCAEQFGVSTPAFVSNRHNQKEKVDWTSGGYIVVNGDGGAGVDLFFALKESATGQVVVIVDQRKLESGRFYPGQAAKYLEKLDICPSFLKAQGARLVRGVVNCIAPSSLATTFDVPENCFLVSKNETVSFHGTTLAYHPACSPIVSINSACETSLKTIFRGNVNDVNQTVVEVVKKRKERGFSNTEEVLSLLRAKRLKVELTDERVEFSS